MINPSFQATNSRIVSVQLKVVYFFLFWAMAVEWFASGLFPPTPGKWPVSTLEMIFLALAFADAGIVWYFRFVRIGGLFERAEVRVSRPVLVKLPAYYIICIVCAHAVAVYGMFARMAGSSTRRAGAFFVAAVALLAFCFPRVPGDSSVPPNAPPSQVE